MANPGQESTLIPASKSSKSSNNSSNTVQDKDMSDKIDIETCKQFKNFDEMKEVIDDYGENVTLHRTKVFQLFNSKISDNSEISFLVESIILLISCCHDISLKLKFWL